MKDYKTTDGNKIRKVGRQKKVYFGNERIYFLWNGSRQFLDEIPRLSYPIIYEDENGKIAPIGGYITITNCFGVLVEITENETIQLWEEIA